MEDVREVGRRRHGEERQRENEANLGSKAEQKLVVVRKTEKLGERERKALFPSEGKGHDDDNEQMTSAGECTQQKYRPAIHDLVYVLVSESDKLSF